MKLRKILWGICKFIFRLFLMLVWGMSRLTEVFLHELNEWLHTIIKSKR